MDVRDFSRKVLTDAFEIKQELKENHYIELCDLIQKIYNHSEFQYINFNIIHMLTRRLNTRKNQNDVIYRLELRILLT